MQVLTCLDKIILFISLVIIKFYIILPSEKDDMIVTFEQEYLRSLYEKGKTDDKKHRFQPEIVRKYKIIIKPL